MRCNVGKVDRIIRLVLGLALVSLVFVGPQTPWDGWGSCCWARRFCAFVLCIGSWGYLPASRKEPNTGPQAAAPADA